MNIKEQAVKFITLGEPCTLDDLFDKLGGYDTFHTVHGDKDRPNPKPIPQKADFNNEADFVEALERYSAYIRVPLDHPSEGGCWCNNDNIVITDIHNLRSTNAAFVYYPPGEEAVKFDKLYFLGPRAGETDWKGQWQWGKNHISWPADDKALNTFDHLSLINCWAGSGIPITFMFKFSDGEIYFYTLSHAAPTGFRIAIPI